MFQVRVEMKHISTSQIVMLHVSQQQQHLEQVFDTRIRSIGDEKLHNLDTHHLSQRIFHLRADQTAPTHDQ